MSFILDALKKSENERQRQIGPSLADAPLRRARMDRPWWAVAVAALLVINLGVLITVLMRNNAAAKTADKTTATEVAEQRAPVVAAPVPAPESAEQPALMPAEPVVPGFGAPRPASNPAVRSLADEAGNAGGNIDPHMNPALTAAAEVPSGAPLVRPIQPPTVTPLPSDPTSRSALAPASATARNEEVLPTAGDLAARGDTLPDLKLDIHVFSTTPSERFVFVNMRKYLEGQTLQEGPVVERITSDGVVLNQHGLRYMLPRQ
jgi:general secretion pathway protein B